jgi:hypothetical protein
LIPDPTIVFLQTVDHHPSLRTPLHLVVSLLDTCFPCSDYKYVGFKIIQSCKPPYPLMVCVHCLMMILNSSPELHLPPHDQQIFFAHHSVHLLLESTQMMPTRRFGDQSLVLTWVCFAPFRWMKILMACSHLSSTGTTNSAVAIMEGTAAKIIENSEGKAFICILSTP